MRPMQPALPQPGARRDAISIQETTKPVIPTPKDSRPVPKKRGLPPKCRRFESPSTTQIVQAVVQDRFTIRPQRSVSDRQGMPARNCKDRSVLQGSRSVQRQMSRRAAPTFRQVALIRSSQGAASRRKSHPPSTIARRFLRPVTRLMSLMAESSRTFISASVFRSSLPGAHRPSVAGRAAGFAGVVPCLSRNGAVGLSGSKGALPDRCLPCQRQWCIGRVLELDSCKDEISVADVLEAVGHAFTIRKGEMSSVARLVFDVEMRSVGPMATCPSRAVNGPKIIEHMGVNLQPFTRPGLDMPNSYPIGLRHQSTHLRC